MYHEPIPKFIISFRAKKRGTRKTELHNSRQSYHAYSKSTEKKKKRNHHIAFVPFVATDERMFRRTPKASGTLRCVVF